MAIQAIGSLAGFSIPADGSVAAYDELWGNPNDDATWSGGVLSLPLVNGNTATFNSFGMAGDYRWLAVHNLAIEEFNLTDTDELRLFEDVLGGEFFIERTSAGKYKIMVKKSGVQKGQSADDLFDFGLGNKYNLRISYNHSTGLSDIWFHQGTDVGKAAIITDVDIGIPASWKVDLSHGVADDATKFLQLERFLFLGSNDEDDRLDSNSLDAQPIQPNADGQDSDFVQGLGTSPHPDESNVDEWLTAVANDETDYDKSPGGEPADRYQLYSTLDVTLSNVKAVVVHTRFRQSHSKSNNIRVLIGDGTNRGSSAAIFVSTDSWFSRSRIFLVPAGGGSWDQTELDLTQIGIHMQQLDASGNATALQLTAVYGEAMGWDTDPPVAPSVQFTERAPVRGVQRGVGRGT